MNTALKTLLLVKSVAAAAIAAAGVVTPAVSMAAVGVGVTPQSGVTCNTNHTAVYADGVLRCRETVTHTRGSICSAAVFQRNGDITLNLRVEMLPAGSDLCRVVGGTATQPSQMTPPLPGMPADSAFARSINASGTDTFVATTFRFHYPLGAIFTGNAGNGVRCPSGFDPARINSGRGLRCEDTVVKIATCDGGFSVQRRGGVDRCTKSYRDIFGNLHTEVGQYTIPANAGYLGIMGNPETHGWNLDSDRSGETDYWIKEDRAYSYAESF
jgi:hypothetical protein